MKKRDLLTHVGLEVLSNHGYSMEESVAYLEELRRLPKAEISAEWRRLRSCRPLPKGRQ